MHKEKNTDEKGLEREKTCPSCHGVFSCYTSGCWCSELPHIMPLDESKGCLCPACLSKEIEYRIFTHNSAT